ncbi:MAG TPA: hypothetical protein VJV79_13700 [Polyangiaceae bacterium]|nr:hypothetical protein [Polyangiaceae bacterium]
MNEQGELLLELSHVGGQLNACADPQAAPSFIDELVDIARLLSVPTDARRDDAPVFLSAPAKISRATWRQCGGLLYALSHDRLDNGLQIATEVAQRLTSLVSQQRGEG